MLNKVTEREKSSSLDTQTLFIVPQDQILSRENRVVRFKPAAADYSII